MPPRNRTKAPKTVSYRKSGADALQQLDKAEKKAEERRNKPFEPFRFWLAPSEEAEVIILDYAFIDGNRPSNEQCCVIKEHTTPDEAGKFKNHVPCISDSEVCPVCRDQGKEGQHVIMMSVISLQEFTTKKGEVVEHSKKLMPIKIGQREKFLELQEHAYRENGEEMGMRGMILRMVRGKGDQSYSIGDPSVMDNGKMYDFIDEDILFEDYGHPEVKSKDKKTVVKEADDDCYPYDYAEIFPDPDVEALWDEFGNGRRGAAGSTRDALDELDEDDKPKRRGRRSRTASNDEEEDDIPMKHEKDTDEEEEDDSPKRSVARRGSRSSSSRSSRPSKDEEEEEPEPARETTSRRSRVGGSSSRTRDRGTTRSRVSEKDGFDD